MTSQHSDRIEVVRSDRGQTMLYVDATFPTMVTLFGPADPEKVSDTDKIWHEWRIATPHGPVEAYNWGRHMTPDPDGDDPALHPSWNVQWHITATGAERDHDAAAHHVATLITAATH